MLLKSLRLFVLIYTFFFAFPSFGQQEIEVISSENNEPIPFARVDVFANKTLIFNVRTDDRGVFRIPFSKLQGNKPLLIRITAYGFEIFEDTLHTLPSSRCPLNPLVKAVDEVVVTGQLASTSSENAIQKIRVIDRKIIEAKGAVNLKDVLQNEMNIRISQDQILGSGMSLQGMSSENVKILIDGVPIIGRLDGNIDLSQINLANIERIEIVEGPSSVSYGTNALAGTINLITKKNPKPGKEFQLNSYYETVGNYNVDGRFSLNYKKHRFSISGGRNFFDGWKAGDPFLEFPQKKIADSTRFKSWKPKEQFQAEIQYSYQFKRTLISPFASFFFEEMTNRGYPRAPHQITAFDDYYRTFRNNQGIQFVRFLNEKYKIQGVVAHNYFERKKNTFLKDLTNLESQLSPNDSDQDTSVFRTWMSRATFSKSRAEAKLNYEVGYDVNLDIAKGKRIESGKKEMQDYALFSTFEWNLRKNFIIRPAVRVAYNSVYKASIIPSINTKWKVKHSNFRMSYARGFRAPSLKELYMDFVDVNHNIIGNSNLKAEKSHHVQGWWNLQLNEDSKWTKNLEVNGFYQFVNQKISMAQDVSELNYSYFNLDEFESTGAQFRFEIKNEFVHSNLGFNLNGTRSSYTTRDFAFTPEFVGNISYLWKKPALNFSLFYKYTGRVQSYLKQEDGAIFTFRQASYSMLDFNLQRFFWKKRISIALGGKNMLNVTTIATSAVATGAHTASGNATPIGWGRSFYVRISFTF